MEKVHLIADFERLAEENDRFFFFKHSSTCPVSAQAFEAYNAFLEEHPEEKGYYLTVQESRDLSNYIAAQYEVIHQSPQAFLFENGQPSWHESHWKITKDGLADLSS
ncbi:bacillithiol system redox-active protein YtxJ [Bacillus thermotolerans]|uniref:General stress protein n=1 Tax=Bacillus thermotolerans TaxID=1221996 RepID=A0A0F5HW20_BACTR|nr:bacillithiol system redox-active protein YtxJ [Bacillus thermotolerans]KKB37559.1 general stress protein [Bacillus thermotolerans]KKB39337.1 general stress protein [Bacillus thermotolerans]KKB43532.1 general stress protein [Bacillus thermotolerans]